MGFPIPYVGVLPKLLFTAAISMAALKDVCSSLLESLGITLLNSHYNDVHVQHDLAVLSDSSSLQQQLHFNPHLHDHHLLLPHRRGLAEAVQDSLPAVLFETLHLKLPHKQQATAGRSSSSSCAAEEALISQSRLQGLCAAAQASSSSSCAGAAAHSNPATTRSLVSLAVCAATCDSCHGLQESVTPESMSSSCSATAANGRPESLLGRSSSLTAEEDHGESTAAYTLQCNHQQETTAAAGSSSTDIADTATTESYLSQCDRSLSLAAAAQKLHADHHLQQWVPECTVCLCEFKSGQEVREMPYCSHIFHKECIDGWILHDHHTCPMCRSLILTPAIPLQEMVHEQELCEQLITSTWFTSLEGDQQEGAYHVGMSHASLNLQIHN